jgi:hypothetical protein
MPMAGRLVPAPFITLLLNFPRETYVLGDNIFSNLFERTERRAAAYLKRVLLNCHP